jgi:hypothetical protein
MMTTKILKQMKSILKKSLMQRSKKQTKNLFGEGKKSQKGVYIFNLIDPGFMSTGVPTKPLKLSALLVNQKATQCTECTAQSHPR